MPVERVREILKIAQEPVSLETPIGEEEDSHLGDFIPDEGASEPSEAASFTLLKEQLMDVLSTLTPREEMCIRDSSGYAVDAEEYCLGLYCIAMPVRDYTEKIVAAVSVSSPAGRMDEERKRIILEALGKCSRDISRSLGYRAAGEK